MFGFPSQPWNIGRAWLVIVSETKFIRKGMNMQVPIVTAVVASMTGLAFAQTQPTRPSAYATLPTMRSAFATAAISPCYPYSSFNPTSSCYTGTIYPSYSAIEPFEFPKTTNKQALPGADSLNEDQVKLRIEAKGYSNVSGLQKDNHGIWRGKAIMKDGSPVAVILDLEGNIYSIRIVFVQPDDRGSSGFDFRR